MFYTYASCFLIVYPQAEMHGTLTFILIPSPHAKPPTIKETVVGLIH